jgi:hypothetical protein
LVLQPSLDVFRHRRHSLEGVLGRPLLGVGKVSGSLEAMDTIHAVLLRCQNIGEKKRWVPETL